MHRQRFSPKQDEGQPQQNRPSSAGYPLLTETPPIKATPVAIRKPDMCNFEGVQRGPERRGYRSRGTTGMRA